MPLPLTPSQALAKARSWCARQERSHSEVRAKLYSWGLKSKEAENVIATLISEGFINEERFAKQYAGGKFRIKKWGKLKILNRLKQKNISEYCITRSMAEIDEQEYIQSLKKLLEKKAKSLRDANPLVKKNKIARYLIGKGYEAELVWEEINICFEANNYF